MLRYVEQSLMKCMHSYTHNIATEKNIIFFQFNCLRLFNAKPSLSSLSGKAAAIRVKSVRSQS